MAERYDCDGVDDASGSPCVRYWSFYAEPDNGVITRAYGVNGGKGYWGHNGAGYAAMLSQVSPAIHAANPQAQVLIGGLAYDWFEENSGPFVRSFLTDTLAALNGHPGGAPTYIDAVAFHYYPINAGWSTIREKALEVRGIMERHGVGDLPLLSPEMGFWSAAPISSESYQARWLVQTYVRGLSVGLQHMLAWARYLRSLQVANAEGYVFRMPGGREKTVVWATAATANVAFPYPCLRRVGFESEQAAIYDGDLTWDQDKFANGQIVLRTEQNTPLYVEPCH
jgi:hypothetical protein